MLERKRIIEEILLDFDINEINVLKDKKDKTEFYEAIHKIDLSSFNENFDAGLISYHNELEMKVAIYYESYGQGIC